MITFLIITCFAFFIILVYIFIWAWLFILSGRLFANSVTKSDGHASYCSHENPVKLVYWYFIEQILNGDSTLFCIQLLLYAFLFELKNILHNLIYVLSRLSCIS